MSQNTTKPEDAPISGAFITTLQNHRRGEVLTDLADSLREVTETVQNTGKAAKLTLSLKIRPASKGGALVLEDEIKLTLPKTETEGSIFFADSNGNLLRENPKQQKLPLRTIEGDKPENEEPLRQVAQQIP